MPDPDYQNHDDLRVRWLYAAIEHNDDAALGRLLKSMNPRALVIASSYVGIDQAEDVVQEAYSRLISPCAGSEVGRRIRRFELIGDDPLPRFDRYILQQVIWTAKNKIGQEKRYRKNDLRMLKIEASEPLAERLPLDSLTDAENLALVLTYRSTLTTKLREVVDQILQNKPRQEAARALKISEETYDTRRNRAVEKLRQRAADDGRL